MRTHGGQGVEAPPAVPSAAPDAFEQILASVPALRRAGLDELADSIEAMAHEVGLDDETVAPAVSEAEPEPEPARAAPEPEPARAAPEPDPSGFRERLDRSRVEVGSAAVVLLVVLVAAFGRAHTALGQILPAVGHSSIRRRARGAIVILRAGAGRSTSILRRARWSVRQGAIRRPELVWGALAMSTMSLVVGWVVTRLP
jgi:hypothetical protein